MTTQPTESTCPKCSHGKCLVCQERAYEDRQTAAGPCKLKTGQVVRWRRKRIDGLGRFRVNAVYFSRATCADWLVDLTVLRAEGPHYRGKLSRVEAIDLVRVTHRSKQQRHSRTSQPLP